MTITAGNPSKVTKRSKDEIAKKTQMRERSIMLAEAICKNGVSIRTACAKLNANRTTVSRRMNGGKSHRQASQDNQYLTPEQETAITKTIELVFPGNCPSLGRNAYRKVAQTILDREFKKNNMTLHKHVSESWEHRLRQRHPILNKFKRNKKLYTTLNNPIFDDEFLNVQTNLSVYKITPENFYSVGEMCLYAGPSIEIDNIGIGPSYREGFLDVFYNSEKTEMVPAPVVQSVCFETCGANGNFLPSFVAFPYDAEIPKVNFEGSVQTVSGDLSTDNDKAFLAWIHFFDKQTKGLLKNTDCYRAIYFGAHYFNLSMEVLEFAVNHNIIFLASPPERTHIEPVNAILEDMRKEFLKYPPAATKLEILGALQRAKSVVSVEKVQRSWDNTGILQKTSQVYKQRVLSNNLSAAGYRRAYAKEFGYFYGKKSVTSADICQICNNSSNTENVKLKIEENSPDAFQEEFLQKVRDKCLEITERKIRDNLMDLSSSVTSVEFAQLCQTDLMAYINSFGFSSNKTMDLLLLCTSIIMDTWDQKNEPSKDMEIGQSPSLQDDIMETLENISLMGFNGVETSPSSDYFSYSDYTNSELSTPELSSTPESTNMFYFHNSSNTTLLIPSSESFYGTEEGEQDYSSETTFADNFLAFGDGN